MDADVPNFTNVCYIIVKGVTSYTPLPGEPTDRAGTVPGSRVPRARVPGRNH